MLQQKIKVVNLQTKYHEKSEKITKELRSVRLESKDGFVDEVVNIEMCNLKFIEELKTAEMKNKALELQIEQMNKALSMNKIEKEKHEERIELELANNKVCSVSKSD